MGKHVDETVYTTLSEFYKNEIKPRKEAKELMVKRRLTPESILREEEPGGDVVATNGVQDHEVSMAGGQLDDIIRNATELKGKVGEKEMNLPGWIQDHISQAMQFINQANTGYHKLGEK